ncbi:DUF7352 domain-containing protein [Nocardiopsis synnemataformans]|uniref:DUF7352 domain-containing protein n=1 Tax=Nocardiopsis synnemataformans TaxID=61305 RepID=UPI003EBD9944
MIQIASGQPDRPTIFRYEVPVDDRWHTLRLSGEILHVAARRANAVELWAMSTDDGRDGVDREFRVVGTGLLLPEGRHTYRGTAIVPGGLLVWHLLEWTNARSG